MAVAWLVRDDEVLASLEIATKRAERARGLLGRDELTGAIWLQPCRSVHTVGMRFAIDVAFVNKDLVVIDLVTMRPNRVSLPRLKSWGVVEATAGSFASWDLKVGDELEIRS